MFSTEYIKFKCLDDIDDDLFVVSTETRGSVNASTGSVVIRNGGLSILSTENSTSASSGGALTIGGGIAINGDVHFSGSLFKNGAEYESQWTETAGNISYTSGNVYVGSLLSNSVSLGMSNIYTGSFIANNNVSVPTDVTGVVFGSGINYFTSTFSVILQTDSGDLYQFFDLTAYKRGDGSGWQLLLSKRGDDTGIDFSITSTGQLQYTSLDLTDFINCTFRYTVTQLTDSGVYNSSAIGTNGNYIFDRVQITNTQNAVSGLSYGGLRVFGGTTFEKNIVVNGTANKIGQLFVTDTTIGIGTTMPGYDLDVNGDINFNGSLYQNGSPFQTTQWESGGNGNLFYTGGNVGVGTTSPSESLDVIGNINFTGDLYQNGSLFQTSQWESSSAGNLYYTAGNVGIGTTVPTAKLDIAGDLNFTGDLYKNGSPYVSSQWTNGTGGSLSYTSGNVVVNNFSAIGLSSTSSNYDLGIYNYGSFQNNIVDDNFHLPSSDSIQYKGTEAKSFGVRFTFTGIQSTLGGDNLYVSISIYDTNYNLISSAYSSAIPAQATTYNTGFVNCNLQSGYRLVVSLEDGPYGTITTGSTFQYTSIVDSIISGEKAIFTGNLSANASNNTLGSIYTNAGNVGIGISNPNARLHIAGNDLNRLNSFITNGIVINGEGRQYNIWSTGSLDDPGLGSLAILDINAGQYRFTVNNVGNIGIGTVSPVAKLDVNGNLAATSATVGHFVSTTQTIGNVLINSNLLATGNSNTVGNLFTTGGNVGIGTTSPEYKLHVTGDIYTSGELISFSDRTLKTDIFTITDALEKVKNLRGVYYTNKQTRDKGMGVIAQEVEEVLPEVIKRGEKLGVAYGNIVGLLIEAIKELNERINIIQTKNQTI